MYRLHLPLENIPGTHFCQNCLDCPLNIVDSCYQATFVLYFTSLFWCASRTRLTQLWRRTPCSDWGGTAGWRYNRG